MLLHLYRTKKQNLMTLVMKQPKQEQNMYSDVPNAVMNAQKSDELTIRTKSSYVHPSPMSLKHKREATKNAPSLQELFNETLKNKGEYPTAKIEELDGNKLEVQGVSQMALHSFILEAEKLGKQIKYTKTYSVKISD